MDHISRAGAALIGVVAVLTLQGCSDRANPADPGVPVAARVATPPYLSVSIGGETVQLWPWSTGTLNTTSPDDPVNLYIAGEGDPRAVRAALMSLSPSPILGCTWSDAIGDEQASAAAPVGWTGSAIQLACGAFGPLPRLHLRLFDIGGAVLGQAHFEIQIPGTSDHQVLSYALAENLVLSELARTGLVTGLAVTAAITPGTHRVIPAVVFNLLPDELQALVTGDTTNAAADVPRDNGDGAVSIVTLGHFAGPSVGSSQAFTIEFGQAVPKPFCQEPGELVYVDGPVQVAMTVVVGASGRLERHFRAQGRLLITPLDGTPSYTAHVTQDHQAWATGTTHWVQARLHMVLVPGSGSGRGMRNSHLRVGTDVPADFSAVENCGAVR